MTIIEAAILGFVQGLTEFLPVSSSGHLEVFKSILNVQVPNNAAFSLIVHLATVLSIIIVFRVEIKNILTSGIGSNKTERDFLQNIVIASIPVIIFGLIFRENIEDLFEKNLTLVGIGFLITSALLAFAHFHKGTEQNLTKTKSFLIGIAQLVAIVPGISRSGSTISAALLLNVKKADAAKFSFFILIVPVLGASFFTTIELLNGKDLLDPIPAAVGFITALIAGTFACKATVEFVKKQKLYYFSGYCFIIGVITLLVL